MWVPKPELGNQINIHGSQNIGIGGFPRVSYNPYFSSPSLIVLALFSSFVRTIIGLMDSRVYSSFSLRNTLCPILALGALFLLCGCGTTRIRSATQQLLSSAAVDSTISQIDFRDLAGKKVFLDTKYMRAVKGVGFVNADYITSSLRQQMMAAELLLQDKLEDAEYVVEARVGALGTNRHEVTYGMPQNASLTNMINTASSMVPTMPSVPTLPEMSFAKKNDERASAKISVFAYHRESKRAVWQSGVSQATSTAKDTWIFGAGPFQSGSIYNGTQFAGNKIRLPFLKKNAEKNRISLVNYEEEVHFKEVDEVAKKPPAEKPPEK
jgi:hypothetical protein